MVVLIIVIPGFFFLAPVEFWYNQRLPLQEKISRHTLLLSTGLWVAPFCELAICIHPAGLDLHLVASHLFYFKLILCICRYKVFGLW